MVTLGAFTLTPVIGIMSVLYHADLTCTYKYVD
jgi:hypothetical protein